MSKFSIPETTDGLSVEELNKLIDEGKKYVRDLLKDENPSDEAVAEATDIIDFTTSAAAQVEQMEADAAAQAAKLEELRAAAAETPAEEVEEPETDKVEETPADEVEEQPADEAENDEPEAEAEVVEENELEAVAASANKESAISRAAANHNAPEVPMTKTEPSFNRGVVTITAAADIPGLNKSAGAELVDIDEVTAAAMKRLQSFGKAKGTRLRQGIATFGLDSARTDGLVLGSKDFESDQAVLREAVKQYAYGSDAITAAGGWCAPADTLTQFFGQTASRDGMLKLPTVGAPRGAFQWTPGPDFSAIFGNADGDWDLTEAEVIADTEKPCIQVECPDFTTETLRATGVCIGAGILTSKAYPELIKDYIEKTLVAHDHKKAQRELAKMMAAATAKTIAGAVVATDSLTYVEVLIEWMRARLRLPMAQKMEVVLPSWYKLVIRNDLARRNGVDFMAVSDGQIASYFAVRGANVQWVYNTGQDITDTANALTIPATVDALVYPQGAFVELTADLITLDGIYDSTNIKTNSYTALFTEEGYEVVNMGGDAFKVALPTFISGQTGAADLAARVVAATV